MNGYSRSIIKIMNNGKYFSTISFSSKEHTDKIKLLKELNNEIVEIFFIKDSPSGEPECEWFVPTVFKNESERESGLIVFRLSEKKSPLYKVYPVDDFGRREGPFYLKGDFSIPFIVDPKIKNNDLILDVSLGNNNKTFIFNLDKIKQ